MLDLALYVLLYCTVYYFRSPSQPAVNTITSHSVVNVHRKLTQPTLAVQANVSRDEGELSSSGPSASSSKEEGELAKSRL